MTFTNLYVTMLYTLTNPKNIMNSVKITIIIAVMLSEMFYLTMALVAPLHITPGWYFWSAFFIALTVFQAFTFGSRLDSWDWRK